MDSFSGKRLVVFGCGYIGAAVALDGVARGARVTALTRNPATALLLREEEIETVVADLAGDAWHAQIEGEPDFVLNCVSSGGGGVGGYRHSYLAGMRSIVAWARRHGPVGTLVYTGSTSVYPQGGGVTIDETAPVVDPAAVGEATERARILLETERELREAAGVCARWFVLRLAGIYGPGRHHLLDQVRSGEVAGHGEHHLNLIHRADVVSAVSAVGAAPVALRNEIYNVVDDVPARKSEVVTWLANRLGVPAPRFTGEPAGTRHAVTPDRRIANAKLKTALGWRPRFPTFREGYESLLSR